jgi:hypothetical protein
VDIEGCEFDWFALDSAGEIGVFSTAGSGFVPESVLAHVSEHDAINETILTPHVGTKQIWSDYASAGLWVFDWGYMGAPGPYQQVGSPSPEMTGDLAERIRSIPGLLRIGIAFRETRCVTVEMISSAQPEGPGYGSQARRTCP